MRERPVPLLPIVLGVLLAVRVVLALTPGTWLWSLALARFVAPVAAWSLVALAALALVPAVARAEAPAFAAAGRALERSWLPAWLGGLAVAIAVFLLTDRTWFTGDFLLRVGVLGSQVPLARIAPQSMPLDLLLHVSLPHALARHEWIADPAEAARWLGAAEAGVLAAMLPWLARAEGASGVAALGFAATVLGGAMLTLMAGYGKTAGELCVLTPLALIAMRKVARDGRGAVALGLVLSIALGIHRSALLFVPGAVTAWVLAARAGHAPRGLPAWGLGAALPAGVLALQASRLAALFFGFDLPHHLAGASAGGLSSGLGRPVAWLDRLNVVLAYAPLAPLLLVPRGRAEPAAGPAEARVRIVEWAVLAPALVLLLVVQPQQGLFRDWDVFVIPGMLLALATGRRVARAIDGDGARAARLVPVVWSAVLAASLWLLAGHDVGAGLARVRAFATEAPDRGDALRGKLWEFLGDRAAELRRWEDAADALRHAVRTEPSPRLWQMLSIAEGETGHPQAAEDALAEAARRDPEAVTLWASWMLLAIQRGDEASAREAARGLRRIAPGHPLLRQWEADSSGTAPAR